jgi:hypothetical protein
MGFVSYLKKYRGKSLGYIINTTGDVDYLEWITRTFPGENIAIAAALVLDHIDSARSDVSSRNEKPAGGEDPAGCDSTTSPLVQVRESP